MHSMMLSMFTLFSCCNVSCLMHSCTCESVRRLSIHLGQTGFYHPSAHESTWVEALIVGPPAAHHQHLHQRATWCPSPCTQPQQDTCTHERQWHIITDIKHHCCISIRSLTFISTLVRAALATESMVVHPAPHQRPTWWPPPRHRCSSSDAGTAKPGQRRAARPRL